MMLLHISGLSLLAEQNIKLQENKDQKEIKAVSKQSVCLLLCFLMQQSKWLWVNFRMTSAGHFFCIITEQPATEQHLE